MRTESTYEWHIDTKQDGEWTDTGEGPFSSEDEAWTFVEREIGDHVESRVYHRSDTIAFRFICCSCRQVWTESMGLPSSKCFCGGVILAEYQGDCIPRA